MLYQDFNMVFLLIKLLLCNNLCVLVAQQFLSWIHVCPKVSFWRLDPELSCFSGVNNVSNFSVSSCAFILVLNWTLTWSEWEIKNLTKNSETFSFHERLLLSKGKEFLDVKLLIQKYLLLLMEMLWWSELITSQFYLQLCLKSFPCV